MSSSARSFAFSWSMDQQCIDNADEEARFVQMRGHGLRVMPGVFHDHLGFTWQLFSLAANCPSSSSLWPTSCGDKTTSPPGPNTVTVLLPFDTSIPTTFIQIPPTQNGATGDPPFPHCLFNLLRNTGAAVGRPNLQTERHNGRRMTVLRMGVRAQASKHQSGCPLIIASA